MSEQNKVPAQNGHEKIEKNVGLMALLIAVVISFGGLTEIVPLMFQAEAVEPAPAATVLPNCAMPACSFRRPTRRASRRHSCSPGT